MIAVSDLPAVNATLNGISTVLLLAGFVAIRRRRVALHRALMLSAFCTSTLFLVCYVIYHYHAGSRPFAGTGLVRPIYFSLLISHVLLAAALLPLVLVTMTRALRGRFESHRRIARWTWPIWMYVSVTGVLIYAMLYHWFVGGPEPTS